MVLRHLYDQNFLFVDSYDPDLLENVVIANLEVNSDCPLLFSVGEGSENALVIERKELAFFTEARPCQE